MEDQLIINNVLMGENRYFNYLIRKYEKQLFAFIYRYRSWDYHTTEDIFQETLFKAYKHLPMFKFKSSFKRWLYSIAMNESNNYFRKHIKYKNNELPISDEVYLQIRSNQNLEEEYILDRKLKSLKYILNHLDEKYKMVFEMYYFEKLKVKDIAVILNESERNVRNKLTIAKKLIKEKLQNDRWE